MKNSENSKKPLRSKPAQGKTSPARPKGEGSKGKTSRPDETRNRPPVKKDQNTERSARSNERTERSGERLKRTGEQVERPAERSAEWEERTERSGKKAERSGERGERTERPGKRAGRPAGRGERTERSGKKAERPSERRERTERSGEKAERSGERGERTERPGKRAERPTERRERTERPGKRAERPTERRERTERPGKRAERSAEQGEQPEGKGKRSGGKGLPRKGKAGAAKSEETRLNKYIAHAGICSRREADKLIEAGMVSVNGNVVTELGTKVGPEDDVRYNGERLGNERKVYLLLNKPKDYVTTLDDPHAKKTVMELISKAGKERIYPVGRLDKNTTGVLLFTNDGDLTKRLTHPSFNKKKIYQVFLDKNLLHSDLQKIAEGVKLDDGIIQVDAIAYTSTDTKKEVGLEIHSGKNRVVRRIFEQLGYKVTKLDRVYFAGLTKKNLPRGRWRFLTEKEVKMLKMNAFE